MYIIYIYIDIYIFKLKILTNNIYIEIYIYTYTLKKYTWINTKVSLFLMYILMYKKHFKNTTFQKTFEYVSILLLLLIEVSN